MPPFSEIMPPARIFPLTKENIKGTLLRSKPTSLSLQSESKAQTNPLVSGQGLNNFENFLHNFQNFEETTVNFYIQIQSVPPQKPELITLMSSANPFAELKVVPI